MHDDEQEPEVIEVTDEEERPGGDAGTDDPCATTRSRINAAIEEAEEELREFAEEAREGLGELGERAREGLEELGEKTREGIDTLRRRVAEILDDRPRAEPPPEGE